MDTELSKAAGANDDAASNQMTGATGVNTSPQADADDDKTDVEGLEGERTAAPYLQNRELSWLAFNERVLDQGADETVPLLERLNFISIFWSNLQEFFMVRVGSLTDLSLVKKHIIDSKSGMTPAEQLDAIYARCRDLYPIQERTFEEVRHLLRKHRIDHLRTDELSDEQRAFLTDHVRKNVMPFLSPQIINSRHPFPHLENGALYVVVRLDEEADEGKQAKAEKTGGKEAKKAKNLGAEGVTLGLIPMPRQCARVIKLPGRGLQFVLLEHAVEMMSAEIFSMYRVKHTNVVCVTRNADLDATEGIDESDEDYREHMKRILKKRARLAPVRLESERPLSPTLQKLLLQRLNLKPHQLYATPVPLDMSYTYDLASRLPDKKRTELTDQPFSPQWPASLDRNRPVIDQVTEKEVLLSYPYESMDAFVQLLREASTDPSVISIKITLYRLASQSHLAEALIAAAENGKEVTALFELRARFDESNNIEWSQRFEQAGCNVIYGFRDFKVHSKICCITRQTDRGLQHITQLGTGNYNEKTAKLYTDLSFITTDETFGHDAVEFFRNMGLENASDNYDILWVAPLQIKPMIIARIDREIERAHAGKETGLLFKTNSITDKAIIDKLAEASQAGVPVTLFVRGISCIVPGVAGFTENVRVFSIVGRLLEHSRIYGFGPRDRMRVYLSSADLMTRNMDKRIEIAWPILDDELRGHILDYLDISMKDTAKLRELLPDKSYTPLGFFAHESDGTSAPLFDSQEFFIKHAQERRLVAAEEEAERLARQRYAVRMTAAVTSDGPGEEPLPEKLPQAVERARDAAATAIAAEAAAEEAARKAAVAADLIAQATEKASDQPSTPGADQAGSAVNETPSPAAKVDGGQQTDPAPVESATASAPTSATTHKPGLFARILNLFRRK